MSQLGLEFIDEIKTTPPKYRDWDILEELPEGWIIDKTAGSPAPRTVFITNGKSLLSGQQKRVLLKVTAKPMGYKVDAIGYIEERKAKDNPKPSVFPAKSVNDLARLKFKEQILKEILFDLTVCEIEGWDKKEYINELKELINEIKI